MLWKKIKTGLSAGRVQSVAVKLVVDRERDIMAHQADHKFTLEGQFITDKKELFRAVYTSALSTKEGASKLLHARNGKQFVVTDVTKKP